MEIKLWQDGTIDLLYGANDPMPGDGRGAVIGIENAEGNDALEFSFYQGLVGPNEAYRFHPVPTGVVQGVVRDTNDGAPIEGASVAAVPGDRSVATDTTGAYSLRLRPGTYAITVKARDYRTATRSLGVAADGQVTSNFKLLAPVAGAAPPGLSADVAPQRTAQATVTVSNTGSSPLKWTARERSVSVTPPPAYISLAPGTVRKHAWARSARPSGGLSAAAAPAVDEGLLSTIISDP